MFTIKMFRTESKNTTVFTVSNYFALKMKMVSEMEVNNLNNPLDILRLAIIFFFPWLHSPA
jgi:hypothetical protein